MFHRELLQVVTQTAVFSDVALLKKINTVSSTFNAASGLETVVLYTIW